MTAITASNNVNQKGYNYFLYNPMHNSGFKISASPTASKQELITAEHKVI